MKLFSDINYTQEIPDIIDFGIVAAGDKKEVTLYAYNESNAFLRELLFAVDHPEIVVKYFPRELLSKTGDRVLIEWRPNVDIKEGLKTKLYVTGKELWG